MSTVSTVSNTNSYTSSSTTNATNAMGKDAFMKLLITQMKYQDPMNPMESTAFASQLAQFSSLEQLTNLNENVTKSMDTNYLLTQSINNTMTAALIGKEVKLSTKKITLNGQSEVGLGVDLPANASTVTVKVYNEYGTLVKEIEKKDLSSGENKLSWDCTDNNGKKVANGAYTYEITATSASGSNLTVTPYVWGTIDSVKFTDEGGKLVVNGAEFALSDVLEILNAK